MKEQKKLRVTNYDNFKNADFFIKQYFEAKKMLKEVDDFFESFIMSKLIESNGFGESSIKPKSIDLGEWLEHMHYDDNYYHPTTWLGKIQDLKYHGYEYVYDENGNHMKDKRGGWLQRKKSNYDEKMREYIEELKQDDLLNKTKKYNTYYVIDKDGVLYDFVPVASKDSIKIDFTKKEIKITGKYYHYHEWGAQWGQSKSCMDEVKVTIYIDPSNNNVVKVLRDAKTIQEGNAEGKSYWDHHEHYCVSSLTGDNRVKTPGIKDNSRH